MHGVHGSRLSSDTEVKCDDDEFVRIRTRPNGERRKVGRSCTVYSMIYIQQYTYLNVRSRRRRRRRHRDYKIYQQYYVNDSRRGVRYRTYRGDTILTRTDTFELMKNNTYVTYVRYVTLRTTAGNSIHVRMQRVFALC